MALEFGSGSAATATTATLNKTAAQITSGVGVVVTVRRASTTAPTTPAGWTLIGSQTASTTIGEWIYARRGDGTFNSVTFVETLDFIRIMAYSGVYDNSFATANLFVASNTNTVSATGLSATEDGEVAFAELFAAGTFGATVTWGGGFSAVSGNGSTSTQGCAEKSLPTTGTAANATASWTTNRYAILGVVRLRVTQPILPPEWWLWDGSSLTQRLELVGVETV